MENEHYLNEHEAKQEQIDNDLSVVERSHLHMRTLRRECEQYVRYEIEDYTDKDNLSDKFLKAFNLGIDHFKKCIDNSSLLEATKNKTLQDIICEFMARDELITEGDLYQQSLDIALTISLFAVV